MIFVRGYGALTLVIPPATAILSGVVASRALTIEPEAERAFRSSIVVCVGFLAGTIINWFVGRRLNGKPFVEVVDPATGLKIRVEPPRHELYWLPMEYWSVPAFLAGAAILIWMLKDHKVF